MTIAIALINGGNAIVDEEDFEYLRQWRWRADTRGYVVRQERIAGGGQRTILMHRVVIDAPQGLLVDHINGRKNDNRRSNLRLATKAQNNLNARRTSLSGYRGVRAERGCFAARIKAPGARNKTLGYYRTAIEAARAYDAAAVIAHGEFALLNFAAERDWIFAHDYLPLPPPAGEDRRTWSRAGTVGSEAPRRMGGDQ